MSVYSWLYIIYTTFHCHFCKQCSQLHMLQIAFQSAHNRWLMAVKSCLGKGSQDHNRWITQVTNQRFGNQWFCRQPSNLQITVSMIMAAKERSNTSWWLSLNILLQDEELLFWFGATMDFSIVLPNCYMYFNVNCWCYLGYHSRDDGKMCCWGYVKSPQCSWCAVGSIHNHYTNV